MSHLILDSGKRINSDDCYRLNYDDSDDSYMGSYSYIQNYEKLGFSDYYHSNYYRNILSLRTNR